MARRRTQKEQAPVSRNPQIWLPTVLEEGERAMVKVVAETFAYDINAAAAFSVALLESCNGHTEAKAVNQALLPHIDIVEY